MAWQNTFGQDHNPRWRSWSGKSAITLDIAARVTSGRLMPDGAQGAGGGVILVGAEDGLADTIRPRLEAAGADLSRIIDLTLPNGKLFQIAEPLALLEQAIHEVSAVMAVIDPIMAYLPPRKRGRKIAKVAMARRVAVGLFWMWRQAWDYQQVVKFSSHVGQPELRHGVQ